MLVLAAILTALATASAAPAAPWTVSAGYYGTWLTQPGLFAAAERRQAEQLEKAGLSGLDAATRTRVLRSLHPAKGPAVFPSLSEQQSAQFLTGALTAEGAPPAAGPTAPEVLLLKTLDKDEVKKLEQGMRTLSREDAPGTTPPP